MERIRVLTGDGVSIHVVEDVPKTEDPRRGRRRVTSEQRGAEFVARLAGVEVRVGLQRRAHAARQRVHLVRSAAAAAAFHLASIALHAHFLARALQRRERQEAEEGKRKEKKKTEKTGVAKTGLVQGAATRRRRVRLW